MKIRKTIPSLDRRSLGHLQGGVYSAERLNPPSGADCTHLLVRADGTLGWCYADGEQSEDSRGQVSRFTIDDLMSED